MTSAPLQLGERDFPQLLVETWSPSDSKGIQNFPSFSPAKTAPRQRARAGSVKLQEEKCDLEPSGLWKVSLP